MKRTLALIAAMLFAVNASADQAAAYRAKNLMNDLLAVSTDLSKEAIRDAEVLRKLIDAARALDDWQQSSAVSKALDNIAKAEQLAGQGPFNPRVQYAVRMARQIVQPAHDSPMNIDQMKIRNDLRSRSVDPMRQVVAEEINTLARLMSQLSEISGLVAKSVASSSAAALGQAE